MRIHNIEKYMLLQNYKIRNVRLYSEKMQFCGYLYFIKLCARQPFAEGSSATQTSNLKMHSVKLNNCHLPDGKMRCRRRTQLQS